MPGLMPVKVAGWQTECGTEGLLSEPLDDRLSRFAKQQRLFVTAEGGDDLQGQISQNEQADFIDEPETSG